MGEVYRNSGGSVLAFTSRGGLPETAKTAEVEEESIPGYRTKPDIFSHLLRRVLVQQGGYRFLSMHLKDERVGVLGLVVDTRASVFSSKISARLLYVAILEF